MRYAGSFYFFSFTLYSQISPSDTLFSKQWGLNITGLNLGTTDIDIDVPEALVKTPLVDQYL